VATLAHGGSAGVVDFRVRKATRVILASKDHKETMEMMERMDNKDKMGRKA
jgi:hypothetical protein